MPKNESICGYPFQLSTSLDRIHRRKDFHGPPFWKQNGPRLHRTLETLQKEQEKSEEKQKAPPVATKLENSMGEVKLMISGEISILNYL